MHQLYTGDIDDRSTVFRCNRIRLDTFLMSFRQGRVDISVKYLQKFIQVNEDSKNDTALSHACNSLGIRLNRLVRIILLLSCLVSCFPSQCLFSLPVYYKHNPLSKKISRLFFTITLNGCYRFLLNLACSRSDLCLTTSFKIIHFTAL